MYGKSSLEILVHITCLVSLVNLFNEISVLPIGRTSWGSPNISQAQAILKLVFLLGNTMTRCPCLLSMEIVLFRCHNRAESAGVHCQGEWQAPWHIAGRLSGHLQEPLIQERHGQALGLPVLSAGLQGVVPCPAQESHLVLPLQLL